MYEDGATVLQVSVSIGLAGYPWGGESVEELIQWADADMYANKGIQEAGARNGSLGSQPRVRSRFGAGRHFGNV
jgi:GGDEF domain-containing protein